MSDQPWTIGQLLNWTAEFLSSKGADSARLDAEVLLAHARGCQRIELYTAFEEVASDELRAAFRELVQQRAAGKPVAYLVGHREFFSLSLVVTPDVLIPRPETEQLVVRALDIAKSVTPGDRLQICDVGVGSGAIAVALAKHLPDARVTAVDVSEAALKVAAENARRHGVDAQIDFVESDLLDGVPGELNFDLVATNPPYVKTAEIAQLAPDVRDYEPRRALDGGEQGVDVIERLLPQVARRLVAGGWLLVEIGPSVADAVESLINNTAGLSFQPTLRDPAGHPRVAQAHRDP